MADTMSEIPADEPRINYDIKKINEDLFEGTFRGIYQTVTLKAEQGCELIQEFNDLHYLEVQFHPNKDLITRLYLASVDGQYKRAMNVLEDAKIKLPFDLPEWRVKDYKELVEITLKKEKKEKEIKRATNLLDAHFNFDKIKKNLNI